MQQHDPTVNPVDLLHKKVKGLMKEKWTEEAIINELTKEGVDPFYAQTIIENINNDISDARNFWKQLAAGIFMVVAGLLINYLSYKIANNHNSLFFYLFWGIVAWGVVMICRAFILFRK